jgi:hypothetical protein
MELLKIILPKGDVLTAMVCDGNIPNIVFSSGLKTTESLREMPWNSKVTVKYSNGQQKELAVGDLMHIIGSDYLAREPPKVYRVNSIDELFKRSTS